MYKLIIELPTNKREVKSTIIVLDEEGRTIYVDQAYLIPAREREREAQRMAGELPWGLASCLKRIEKEFYRMLDADDQGQRVETAAYLDKANLRDARERLNVANQVAMKLDREPKKCLAAIEGAYYRLL